MRIIVADEMTDTNTLVPTNLNCDRSCHAQHDRYNIHVGLHENQVFLVVCVTIERCFQNIDL